MTLNTVANGTYRIIAEDKQQFKFILEPVTDIHSGYWVAVSKTYYGLAGDLTALGSIAKWYPAKVGDYIGVWSEGENLSQEFDLVAHIDNLEDAMRIGRNNNQKAIWDIANNTEVWL